MGKIIKFKHRRWKAYSHAATAVALHVTRVVPIGDIDLAEDYPTLKLEEIGQALQLEKTTEKVPATACIAMNWGTLAQVNIGAPRDLFANESMAEILVEDDPIGLKLMRRHWRQIERLAEMLLRKGRLSAMEAVALIEQATLPPSTLAATQGNRPYGRPY